ncbi:MAG TPA: universal stress protein [Thermoanaerobaculia bacterium]|nr:universal stress protein [Thermoanaerobaculia bacterium]
MFRNILVPVDFTLKNEAALTAAIDLVKGSSDAKVTLLHVIETIEHVEFDEMADFYRSLETRSAAKLYGMEERLKQAGISVYHEIVYGKRAETIVAYAEERAVDLIVLSSHKVDRDHPALGIGTLSYRVAIVARCPVLLVK